MLNLSDQVPDVAVVFPPLRVWIDLPIPSRDERGLLLARRAIELSGFFQSRFRMAEAVVHVLPAVGAVIVNRALLSPAQTADGSTVIVNYALPEWPRFAPDAAGTVSRRKGPVREPRYDPVIGMIDTGITPHSEFSAGQLTCIQLDGAGGITGTALTDTSGHGTFVGALIAGNSLGVLPGARLAVASVMARRPATYADFVKGVDWLVGGRLQGETTGPVCDLINLSGGTRWHDSKMYRPLEEVRVRFGVLCVAAAGNDGNEDEVDSPADYDICLGVGSHDAGGGFYSAGTDWGTVNGHVKPDVCAEGVKVVSAGTGSPTEHVAATGTSFATAMVSGAIGRLLATGAAPALDPLGILTTLSRHSTALTPDTPQYSRQGRVDIGSLP